GGAVALDGESELDPATPPAVHRANVAVSHLLERVGRQSGAKATPTVEDDVRVVVGNRLLDVALDDALAEVRRPPHAATLPLTVFAHVDQVKLLARFLSTPDLLRRGLADALLALRDQPEKSGCMLHLRAS